MTESCVQRENYFCDAPPRGKRRGRSPRASPSKQKGRLPPAFSRLNCEQYQYLEAAGPPGHRSALVGIGGHQRPTREQHAVIAAIVQPAVLGFGAHHPVRSELIVEAALYAAEKTRVAALQGVAARKRAADMAADIES